MVKNEILQLLDQLGLAWQNIINGTVGATIWAIHKKNKFWPSLRQVFIGGITAGYVTPFLSKEISINAAGFLGFVIGMIGMVIVDRIYVWASKKIKLLFD